MDGNSCLYSLSPQGIRNLKSVFRHSKLKASLGYLRLCLKKIFKNISGIIDNNDTDSQMTYFFMLFEYYLSRILGLEYI